MTSHTLKNIAQVSALLCAGISAAASAGDWSPWHTASGDSSIAFRYKVHSYGSGLTPSCDVEVHNLLGRMISVRADLTVALGSGPVKTTRTFWVNPATQIATDAIFSCGGIDDFQVTNAVRR
jgi:hypothetical protein